MLLRMPSKTQSIIEDKGILRTLGSVLEVVSGVLEALGGQAKRAQRVYIYIYIYIYIY